MAGWLVGRLAVWMDACLAGFWVYDWLTEWMNGWLNV
jgi:hypothetical protein